MDRPGQERRSPCKVWFQLWEQTLECPSSWQKRTLFPFLFLLRLHRRNSLSWLLQEVKKIRELFLERCNKFLVILSPLEMNAIWSMHHTWRSIRYRHFSPFLVSYCLFGSPNFLTYSHILTASPYFWSSCLGRASRFVTEGRERGNRQEDRNKRRG